MHLTRVVRDSEGIQHRPGEPVKVLGKVQRANFDTTKMYVVEFAMDHHRGMVFCDEVNEEEE